MQRSFAAPMLPLTAQVRNLLAVCYPEYMEYTAYSAGMDVDDPECVLELTMELHRYFDREFPPILLGRCLAELKPRVLLLPVPEMGRVDWPWLEEENLDRVFEWCIEQQYPNRPNVVTELVQILTPNLDFLQEPQLPYGLGLGLNQVA